MMWYFMCSNPRLPKPRWKVTQSVLCADDAKAEMHRGICGKMEGVGDQYLILPLGQESRQVRYRKGTSQMYPGLVGDQAGHAGKTHHICREARSGMR